MADVDFTFSGDFENIKQQLTGLHAYIKQWGESVKGIGIAAFAWTVVKDTLAAIINTLRSMKNEFMSWIHAAQASELINVRLGIAVKNAGAAVGYTTKQLMSYAQELSHVSIFSSDEIKATERKLISMGVYGDKLKEIIELATQVSSVEGRGLEQTAVAINRALGMLANPKAEASTTRRMLGGAGVFLSPEELGVIEKSANKQAGLLSVLTKRYASAAAEIAGTGHGIGQMLSHIWGDIKADLGQGFLEMLKAVKNVLFIILEHVKQLTERFAEWLKVLAGGSTATLWVSTLEKTLLMMFAAVEEFLERVPALLAEVKASILETANVIADIFDAPNEVGSLLDRFWELNAKLAEREVRGKRTEVTDKEKELGVDTASLESQQKNKDQIIKDFGVEGYNKGIKFTQDRIAGNIKSMNELNKEIIELEKQIEKYRAPTSHEGLTKAAQDARTEADKLARGQGSFGGEVKARYDKMFVEKQFAEHLQFAKDAGKVALKWGKKIVDSMFPPQPLAAENQRIMDMLQFKPPEGPKSESVDVHEALIDQELKKMALGFKAPKEFKSSIEDAQSVFRRIQTSAAGKELSEAEKRQIAFFDGIKNSVKNEQDEAFWRRKAWENLSKFEPGVGA